MNHLLNIAILICASFIMAAFVLPWMRKRYMYWKLYRALLKAERKVRPLIPSLADNLTKLAQATRKKAIGI